MTAKKSEQLKVSFGLYYVHISSILYFSLNEIVSVLTKQLLLSLHRFVFKGLLQKKFKALLAALQAGICAMYHRGAEYSAQSLPLVSP